MSSTTEAYGVRIVIGKGVWWLSEPTEGEYGLYPQDDGGEMPGVACCFESWDVASEFAGMFGLPVDGVVRV